MKNNLIKTNIKQNCKGVVIEYPYIKNQVINLIEFTKHFPNNLVKYKKLNLGGKYDCKKTFKQEFEV